jgi:hypothetical protein
MKDKGVAWLVPRGGDWFIRTREDQGKNRSSAHRLMRPLEWGGPSDESGKT